MRDEDPDDKARSDETGLLGFSPRPIDRADEAYFEVFGLTRSDLDLFVESIRSGDHPMIRRSS